MTTERQKTETDLPPHELISAALDYAHKGFRVFPLHSVDDQRRCTCRNPECGSPGKHPRNRYGLTGATTNEAQIRKWWQKYPDSNIGIRTGRSLFVLDVDGDEGEESLYELVETHGQLFDTWESLTGRGRHIYFLLPANTYVQSSRSLVGNKLDIRCEGGYVVAPPSRHYFGNRYEWELSSDPEDIPLAEVPDWLIDLACTKKTPKPAKSNKRRSSFKAVLHIGERNETLFKEACHMRDLGLARERVEHYTRLRNRCDCLPPLKDAEVDTLLCSAFSYPKRNPRKGGLSKGSERVFRYILEKSMHRGHCKLGEREIAEAVGLSKRHVSTCIHQLERYGMVRVQEHNGLETSIFSPDP